jgi:transposase
MSPTKNPAKADTSGQPSEYGRVEEVQQRFGLSKGTIYNLLRAGRIRGCSLQVKGKRSRIRLIDMSSVSELIATEINNQAQAQHE